jgi:4-methylaminobutanoate oxidase (formaldehyde-forming)
VPVEFAAHVYERLTEAGAGYGLRHAGLHCQDCLRLEKGFKHWGHDIGPEDTPLEAGLGFAVAWDKNADFIGRDALMAQREAGLTRRLAIFTVDGAPRLLHEEPIWRDGKLVGTTTSGGYAFSIGKPISMGYVELDGEAVTRDTVLAGSYEIEVAGEKFAAEVSLGAPFDPKGERMRS